jgi:tRNA pseudouridine38-40 synthase
MRYFFHIGYLGTNYRGWQRQTKAVNVQEVVESALGQIFKKEIVVTGCGRTDAGVHASQFFFHVDLMQPWDFDLLFRINKVLPDDIAVFDIHPLEGEPHARFDATTRTYDYFIHTYKDPFLHNVSSYYPEKALDLDKMRAAASLLLRYNDYASFCKSPASYRTTICNVTYAALFMDSSGDRLRFSISANRFLSKMIRVIVGKLLNIGRGELSLDTFESYLATKQALGEIEPAYPQGLFLSKVTYPFLDLPARTQFSLISENAGDWARV